MIDADSGAITFDRGTVARTLSRRGFLASPLAAGATLDVDNGEHRTYALARPLAAGGRAVAASLSFEGEALRGVSLTLADDRVGRSWDEWSENKERARHAAHTRWLRGVLGGQGPAWTLPWGVVESGYDAKAAFSSISIRYAAR
ncbi:MAG TPA: hypothetical protein VF997_03230 [Polyangia bacterium]